MVVACIWCGFFYARVVLGVWVCAHGLVVVFFCFGFVELIFTLVAVVV